VCWDIVDIDRHVDLETTIDLKEIETNKQDHAEVKKGDEAV
jgi:predicted RNA-binding protein with PUA-like domain